MPGYLNIELIDAIAPQFFDDKKRSICLLSAASILKILLPERQTNKKIYISFKKMLDQLKSDNWINLYIFWELSLIKELGFEVNFFKSKQFTDRSNNSIKINDKFFKVPNLLFKNNINKNRNNDIREALIFNKNLLMENFIIPNGLKFPLSRKILEKYYN